MRRAMLLLLFQASASASPVQVPASLQAEPVPRASALLVVMPSPAPSPDPLQALVAAACAGDQMSPDCLDARTRARVEQYLQNTTDEPCQGFCESTHAKLLQGEATKHGSLEKHDEFCAQGNCDGCAFCAAPAADMISLKWLRASGYCYDWCAQTEKSLTVGCGTAKEGAAGHRFGWAVMSGCDAKYDEFCEKANCAGCDFCYKRKQQKDLASSQGDALQCFGWCKGLYHQTLSDEEGGSDAASDATDHSTETSAVHDTFCAKSECAGCDFCA